MCVVKKGSSSSSSSLKGLRYESGTCENNVCLNGIKPVLSYTIYRMLNTGKIDVAHVVTILRHMCVFEIILMRLFMF